MFLFAGGMKLVMPIAALTLALAYRPAEQAS
jgi:hypothetical protein